MEGCEAAQRRSPWLSAGVSGQHTYTTDTHPAEETVYTALALVYSKAVHSVHAFKNCHLNAINTE